MYGMFDDKAEKAKIVQLLRENVEAANRGDIEASLRHFDRNCYFLSPQMKLMKGLSDLRGFYEALDESSAHTEKYAVIDIHFSENGNMAYMITNYHMVLKGTEGNVDNIGKSLQVLSKKSGKWKIVAVGYNADE